MKLIYFSLDKIVPYKNNPRKIQQKAIDIVAKSIKEFGFKNPIIIDKNNVIVAGHTRLKAAQQLGMQEIPTICADDLTEKQIKAFRLVDNKTSELTKWDDDLLIDELKIDFDFDMAEFDFDMPLFASDEQAEQAEVVPKLEDCESRVKEGDIWHLGRHKIMCGDCTDKQVVEKLMAGKKADMVFTDPPYGIDYSGGRTQTVKHREYGKIANDDLVDEELGDLLVNIFSIGSKEFYICVSPILQKPFLDFIHKNNRKPSAVIVWDKGNAGLGYMKYRRQCEFIIYLSDIKFKIGDSCDFDLWSITRDNSKDYKHGNQKPVEVCLRAIKNSSKTDNIVFDFFLGSGSTLIACEQANRICYGLEISPDYCNIIIKRWEDYTGEKAAKGCERLRKAAKGD